MIRWTQVPREGKSSGYHAKYTVSYIIICESDTMETQVLFSMIKFGTAKPCFSMPKDKKNEMLNVADKGVLYCKKLSTILSQTFAGLHSELYIFCN